MKDVIFLKMPLLKSWRRATLLALCSVCALSAVAIVPTPVLSETAQGVQMISVAPAEILHELDGFRQMGSVLYIAAHPDDENTELLAYLARGRNYRTAYMSLTRGDGGQNVLSSDLGDKLGVARTQELLAARQLDGAQQFFSRAIDFGFSKSYLETLKNWDKQEVLSDIVRVIRKFHPDVIITRFSPSPGGTHGHHTASAVLAIEAFKAAADPKAFPEQKLQPWQAKRIFWNTSTFQADKTKGLELLSIDAGGKDVVSGETFTEIAQKSRAMHKTQGFDTFKFPGTAIPERIEKFQFLGGEPATKDIMDGVDTSWKRVPGGEAIAKPVDEIIANFDKEHPANSVAALLKLRSALDALAAQRKGTLDSVVIAEKQKSLDRILQACLGLKVETNIAQADVVPGETLQMHHSVVVNADLPPQTSLTWVAVRYPGIDREIKRGVEVKSGSPVKFDSVETIPKTALLTQPYWLEKSGTAGMFSVENADLIGTAENAPAFPVEDVFEIGGQKLVVTDQPVQISKGANDVLVSRKLDIIPPVSMRFTAEVVLLTPKTTHTVEVEITATRAAQKGVLKLEAPPDWKIIPTEHTFDLAKTGQNQLLKFTVTAPSKPETARILASAKVGDRVYHSQNHSVSYAHLPPQLLQTPASIKAVSFELITRGHTIGYLPGAGDSLPENLEQMGYAVKILDDKNLDANQLRGLDAVVLGVRIFNVRKDIASAMPVLFEYVQNGGTVVSQYNVGNNRLNQLKTEKIAPYDLHISGDRVTDEKSAVTFLAPDSSVLNTPNKITQADFEGWVQERGLYFPDKWDDHFQPIISISDPDEAASKSSLLVAKYGKGHWIYTGLSFFRQLPAGVPGAFRLMANLLSIEK
jgi:LmbE family N-acetylglucosaminyl deacetylase